MHTAPVVDYPVGRSRFHALVLLAVGSALAVVYGLWFALTDLLGWRHWLGLSFAVAVALTACAVWRSVPTGSLCWDGQSWWWESQGVRVSGAVASALDLQFVVLLSFRPHAGACHWFWLERSAAAMHWDGLRRAVAASGQGFGDAGDDSLAMRLSRRGGPSKP